MKKKFLVISTIAVTILVTFIPMFVSASEKFTSFKLLWGHQPRVPKSLL